MKKIVNSLHIIIPTLLFILIFIHYYPQYLTYGDEGEYLHTTYLLSEGISPKVTDPLLSHKFATNYEIFYPQYLPGTSIILLPFAMVGWKLIFMSGLLLHLFNFFLMARILRIFNYKTYFALLYLFFPGIVFFSRTIMSELGSITLILIGFYFYIKNSETRNIILAGLFFGLACWIRYTNGVVFGGFFIATFLKDWKKAFKLTIGFLIPIILLISYNYYLYGSSLIGYPAKQFTGSLGTNLYDRLSLIWKFALPFMIIYPFMFFSPFIYRGKASLEILLSLIMTLGFYLIINAQIFHYDFIKNIVIGPRYFFILIPFMIITYSHFLTKLENIFGRVYKVGFSILIIFMILAVSVMSATHYNYTSESYNIMKDIYENTEEGSLIFGNTYVLMYVNGLFGDRKAIKIYPFLDRNDPNSRLQFIPHYSDKLNSYLVFIDNRESNDPLEKGRKISGAQGEDHIIKYYNTELVYERLSPYHLKIYKVMP